MHCIYFGRYFSYIVDYELGCHGSESDRFQPLWKKSSENIDIK